MRVNKILSEVSLVIADLAVSVKGEIQSCPTLCAVVPGEGAELDRLIPLNTPDGRPIFMNYDHAHRPLNT